MTSFMLRTVNDEISSPSGRPQITALAEVRKLIFSLTALTSHKQNSISAPAELTAPAE